MSQTIEVNTEPLKWPIAPDGYIPNSVIRSWRRKRKELTKMDCCDDIFFYSLHQVNECTTNDQADVSTRIFWFIQDEEEEREETDDVERRLKEKENEKNKKDNVDKTVVEEKERMDEKTEKEEDKLDRTVLEKQSYNIDTEITPQTHLKTFDDRNMYVEPKEVSLTDKSKKTVELLPTSCHENGHKPQRELRDDMKPPESITCPLLYPSVPNKQSATKIILKERPEPPVVSADDHIPKQEPRITSYTPPTEPKTLTPHSLKPLCPTPEDPQPQPNLGPPECSAIRDNKYSNTGDQAHVHLDRKVLELYKKFKVRNKNSQPGKLSTTAERPFASKAAQSTIQTKTGRVNLRGGLGSPSEFRATLSTIQTRACTINPEFPSDPICSNYPAQFAQNILQTKRIQSMPEWRKNLYKLISLQDICSPRAARMATTEHLVKSSNTRKIVAAIPTLQPGQAAAHQRVVHKIEMKDTIEPVSCHFHHVIPMASQHSFFTLDPYGKTQYGRLQFDWMRGSEEEKLLKVSAVKIKDTAHKVVDKNRDFNHLNRSA